MLEFCSNCSVSFVTLDCHSHVTLSKQIDHFNLNQPPKHKKIITQGFDKNLFQNSVKYITGCL